MESPQFSTLNDGDALHFCQLSLFPLILDGPRMAFTEIAWKIQPNHGGCGLIQQEVGRFTYSVFHYQLRILSYPIHPVTLLLPILNRDEASDEAAGLQPRRCGFFDRETSCLSVSDYCSWRPCWACRADSGWSVSCGRKMGSIFLQS